MLSQIQPHFLYNSLVAIQELCLIDPETASKAVGEFSNYLRGNLDSLSIKRPIPFEHELRHVKAYLSLEKKRFGEKLNINYDISYLCFNIPALTLQPIAENAVQHGVTKREDGGTVTVSVKEAETEAVITVIDDGVGFDRNCASRQDGRLHLGIENVRSRLAFMCNGTLTIQSEPDVGTTAVITVPKEGR
jgi:sensor histidine kinase YesM